MHVLVLPSIYPTKDVPIIMKKCVECLLKKDNLKEKKYPNI